MTIREVVRKLRAFEAGQAQPRFSTKHVMYSRDPIHVSFVRLSGETRPWAVGWEIDGKRRITSVVDGRRYEDVRRMLKDFSDDFLEYFRAAGVTWDAIDKDTLPLDGAHPQLWVPAATHIDMLHYLSYAYWRPAKTDNNQDDLTALARLCGHLFRETSYPGQQIVCDASRVLRDLYAFPTDDTSLGHVGTALTWIGDGPPFTDRFTFAREAGRHGLGISLDADIENPLHDLFDIEADKTDFKLETEVKAVLEEEIDLRLDASIAAYRVAVSDQRRTNAGVAELVKDSFNRYCYEFQSGELKIVAANGAPTYTPHPETDHHGSAAASRFYSLNAASSKHLPTLIHDDHELLHEALAEGRAIKGLVTAVTVSGGRAKTICWTISTQVSDEFRLSESDSLSPTGSSGHVVKPRSIDFVSETTADLQFEFVKKKTLALSSFIGQKPDSQAWVGQEVTLVPSDSSSLDTTASFGVWKARAGAGAWLTHSKVARSPDSTVLSDVSQLEGGRDS